MRICSGEKLFSKEHYIAKKHTKEKSIILQKSFVNMDTKLLPGLNYDKIQRKNANNFRNLL